MKEVITFIHTSDWEPNCGAARPKRAALAASRADRSSLFDRIESFLLRVAIDPPDLLLFAGDMFDGYVPIPAESPLDAWTRARFDCLAAQLRYLRRRNVTVLWAAGSHDYWPLRDGHGQIKRFPNWDFYEAPWNTVFKEPEGRDYEDEEHGIVVVGFGGLGGSLDSRKEATSQYREGRERLCGLHKGRRPMIVLTASSRPEGNTWRKEAPAACYIGQGGLTSGLDKRKPQRSIDQVVCVQGSPWRWEGDPKHLATYPIVRGRIDRRTFKVDAKLVNPDTFEDWPLVSSP